MVATASITPWYAELIAVDPSVPVVKEIENAPAWNAARQRAHTALPRAGPAYPAHTHCCARADQRELAESAPRYKDATAHPIAEMWHTIPAGVSGPNV